jgi:hypothetical protein
MDAKKAVLVVIDRQILDLAKKDARSNNFNFSSYVQSLLETELLSKKRRIGKA